MTLQVSKKLKRVTMLLVIACMIAGLASPVSCDEFYNNLLRLNGHNHLISNVNSLIANDFITAEEAVSHNQYLPEEKRSGKAGSNLIRIANEGAACSFGQNQINRLFFLLLAAAACAAALSHYHILFIHLKDGHK